ERGLVLAQLATLGPKRERQVRVGGLRQAEQALQQDLPWRRVEQVGAAHDLADALRRIVDDDRELVRTRAVRAPDHEVADVAPEILLLSAQHAIGESDRRGTDAQPPGRW